METNKAVHSLIILKREARGSQLLMRVILHEKLSNRQRCIKPRARTVAGY